MQPELSWDEFRLVKAIADSRSLVGAADRLNLNHSTIFRRLGAIETGLGLRLFERSRAGYQPTAAGEEMLEVAASMGESILEFERRVSGRDVQPSGELRVTTADSIGAYIVPQILQKFRERYPAILIDLNLSSQLLNLSRRDADVALRATNQPPETLIGRRLCALRWAIYCSQPMMAKFDGRIIEDAPWVGFGDNFGAGAARRWIEKAIPAKRIVCRINAVVGMAEAIESGVGAGLLPRYIGDQRAGLLRLDDAMPDLDVGLWILTHPDLRHSARVRAFMDFTANEIVKIRRLLEGSKFPAMAAAQ